MHRLKCMKEKMMDCVMDQMEDLASVNAEELGEAVDIIKDLSEAIYYCTIVDSMKGDHQEKHEGHHWEGRSHMTRKSYMEHKSKHMGKETLVQKMEEYIEELTADLMEMIDEASLEEKQMLAKKLATLASHIV